jgi:hypothetical protein
VKRKHEKYKDCSLAGSPAAWPRALSEIPEMPAVRHAGKRHSAQVQGPYDRAKPGQRERRDEGRGSGTSDNGGSGTGTSQVILMRGGDPLTQML